jgi:hypothetical protein
MDDRQFDALTRALARGSSRRTALKGLLGALVGGVALTTRLDKAGAQACDPPCPGICCNGECAPQCCSAVDCDPFAENECRTTICDETGHCASIAECLEGQQCCNLGTPEHYCAYCCSDEGCPGCQVCNAGVCEQPECCGDSDCVSVCGECVEGECITRCTTGEYCCAFANDCRALGECCTDDECPCGGACIDGTCLPQPPCLEGQECCGDECVPLGECAHLCIPEGDTCAGEQLECCLGLQCCEFNGGSACQKCCNDSDCPGECEICVEGTCAGACSQSQECCNDECVALGSCCREPGETCAVTDGPGTQGNCCDDLLCCAGGEGGYCAECCSDNDCGPCGFCSGGICLGECSQSQECCERECVDIGTCCQDVGDYCTFGEPDPGDEPAVCCSGLVCCETETSAACAECCGDSDCGPCAYCADGVCYGECSQSESCCNGQCVEDDDCCTPEGSICGVAPSDDSSQLDCCDGLVCCDNLYYGVSVCAECCVDADCAAGGWCDEGECKYPHACTDDKHCPKGTCCCKDGSCSGKCCHHPHPPKPPKPPKPAPAGGDVSTLPATGAGNASESGGLLGAAALGAAAALFAAKKLRDDGTIDDRPEAG